MPVVAQQPLIEQSDFTFGWTPDGLTDSTVPEALPDVSNLLIDRATASLATRPGFRRLLEELSSFGAGSAITSDHYIKQVENHIVRTEQYLIVVVVKLVAAADNVQLYAVKLSDLTVQRIDTAGVTWDNPEKSFWFQAVDGILYGGNRGNPMFSWDAAGPTYNDDAGTPNTKEWTDDTGSGVNTATEYGRDNAWTGKEFVEHNGDIYQPQRDIKYDKWETGEHYRLADRVSRKGDNYWRSYRCIKAHNADSAKAPDTGGDWQTYWKRVKLDSPTDEDGVTNDDWAFIPAAAESGISMWFANRLWLRFDGQGDNSRMQYSAPIKIEKDQDIPDTDFDPADWAPGNDRKGQGGGWIPFNDGSHSGPISAARAFGQYGIVFKRHAVWVVSGSGDTTWNVRLVAKGVGCVGPKAHVEHDGLVYFLDDNGLHVTDGTSEEEVPANAKVHDYITARLDSALLRRETDGAEPQLFKWDGFIGIALPDASNASLPFVTLFYDPVTQSFWKTTVPVLDWATFNVKGIARSIFCRAPSSTSDSPLDLLYEFDHSTAADTDDTGAATYATAAIPWSLRTAWLPFGTHRQERRIRRLWCVVKGNINYTITQYRNWLTSSAVATNRAPAVATTVHIEGAWMADCHSMSIKVDGDAAPASFYGYGVDTEPRRARYHTG